LAFRLPATAHVGAVHLLVSDLPRSIEYYERVIGLRTYAATADTASLGPHGEERPLLVLASRAGLTRARRGAFGLYHFAILLPDRPSLGRFAAHLGTLGERVGMADHLVSEALYLWDPDNLGIEVYADRPRETWRRRGGELAMTTDPLDLDHLIASGAGGTWDGAPPGTMMGHVHLHVGNLEEAAAFYHRGAGFDKTVWSYPGALFMSAGGYHHHLATNVWAPGPAPADDHARLLEWELRVPSDHDVAAVAQSVQSAGYTVASEHATVTAVDPWGTRLRVKTGG
jgi:catechol 2,3-dioxygenase